MVAYLLLAASVAYLAVSGLYLGWMLRYDLVLRRAGLAAMVVATAIAGVALGLELSGAHPPPLSDGNRIMLVVSLGASLVFLLARLWQDLPLFGSILGPLCAIMMFVLFVRSAGFAPIGDSGMLGAVTIVHIGATVLGVLLFAPAYVLSILFLHQEYKLRQKRRPDGRLPSLLSLETNAWRLLFIGFPLYTVGIILGLVWQERAHMMQIQPQHVLAATGWALYAFVTFRRLRYGWRGRRAALTLMVAFVITLGGVLLYSMR